MNAIRKFFSRFTSSKTDESPDRASTAPLDPAVLESISISSTPGHLLVGAAQSTGMERSHNEDALFFLVGNAEGENALPDFGYFIVADGMGGHRSGEIASSLSVRSVARHLSKMSLPTIFTQDSDENGASEPTTEILRKAMEDANDEVVKRVPGGGTTLTVVVFMDDAMTVGHVGDSRAYVMNGDQTKVITKDHSLVERLIEIGTITEEEAAVHPKRNVLYRAIGQGEDIAVDVNTHSIPYGGYLLLCSDGLWGVVEQDKLEDIVHNASHPQVACDELIKAANAAGGPDNITAILVYFPPV